MKRRLPILLSLFVLAASVIVRAETDAEVQARKDDHSLVAVNLYAGNQYWFSAGATEPAKKIAVSVYDETGKQVKTEGYNNGEKAAAGFSPENSGQYFVSIDLVEGEEGSFCLVYSYK